MTINELENQEERNREECERCSKKEKEKWLGEKRELRKKKAFSELFNWNRNGYRIGYKGRLWKNKKKKPLDDE